MAISLKHDFQSGKADGIDSTVVQPSNWNEEHVLTAATGVVLGRMTAGTGAVEELPIVVDATGMSVRPPEGTTAQRPAGVNGMIRFNTTTGQLEAYQGGAWGNFADIAMTPMAQATVKGRAINAGTGAPADLTRAQLQRLVYNIGTAYPTFNSTADDGFVFPFGQNLSRTTYSELFAKYSTTYGAGDGVNTFGMPDARGRVLVGKDNMGGVSADRLTGLSGGIDGDTLGATGGSQSHVLSIAELPTHNHTASFSGNPLGAHSHQVQSADESDSAPSGPTAGNNNKGNESPITTSATSAGTPAGTVTVNNQGSGSAHNNVQPSIVCNVQIYTGVHA